ncbi:MAG: hypothetical protein U1E23_00460 [Reyranellaceae bacterium]
MKSIATLNTAEIETVVGGIGISLPSNPTEPSQGIPRPGTGGTPQRPGKQNSSGTMDIPR